MSQKLRSLAADRWPESVPEKIIELVSGDLGCPVSELSAVLTG
jgi:hypothetical protein